MAFLRVHGKRVHCGMWLDELDAGIARDRAALHLGLDLVLDEPDRSTELGPATPDSLRLAALRDTAERLPPPRRGGPRRS